MGAEYMGEAQGSRCRWPLYLGIETLDIEQLEELIDIQ